MSERITKDQFDQLMVGIQKKNDRIEQLEARLAAVKALPDKWANTKTKDAPPVRTGNDCANELNKALAGAE